MKNAFYFMLKAFVLKKLNFFPDIFGHVGKQRVKKAGVNTKIYDVTNWKINNYNTHTARCFKK